jgi:hypothetical protein
MITNPTPILHQNIRLAMESSTEDKPVEQKGGLLAPRRPMAQKQSENDMLNPTKRVASYIQLIQQKREEVKNG